MMLRFPVLPMKATMASLPSDDEGWAYEIKWDGYRTVAFVEGGAVRLQSSSGRDVTARWPEVGGLADAVNAGSVILDGELVVVDGEGRPNFGHLQQSGVGSKHQAALYVFDVLQVEGTDTIGLPYRDRRQLLSGLVEAGQNWAIPSHSVGNGADLVRATVERGLEGVIAKRLDSIYHPGTRTKEWRKIKNRIRTTLAVGGFTHGTGNRSSSFGALLVGKRRSGDSLEFAGGVGTGFDQKTLATLTRRLRGLATDGCPFDPPPPAPVRRTATWVTPSLDATIEIAEFTNDGLVRHASFLHLE